MANPLGSYGLPQINRTQILAGLAAAAAVSTPENDVFNTPTARALEKLYESESHKLEKELSEREAAEKIRKDSERALMDLHSSNRAAEVNAAVNTPTPLSSEKLAIKAACANVNYSVIGINNINRAGGGHVDIPIDENTSCYDILEMISTLTDTDIKKIAIFSFDLPVSSRCITIENCDIVEQSIRNKGSFVAFLKGMSTASFRASNILSQIKSIKQDRQKQGEL